MKSTLTNYASNEWNQCKNECNGYKVCDLISYSLVKLASLKRLRLTSAYYRTNGTNANKTPTTTRTSGMVAKKKKRTTVS